MQILLKNNIEAIDRLNLFLKEFFAKYNIPKNTLSEIDLALGELILNVIKYGYKEKQNSSISLNCEVKESKITLVLTDEGKAFNPLEYKIKNQPAQLEDKTIGGLGIMIAKKSMDDISYQRKGNKNKLTLIKLIKNQPS